jgi:hypothetical protein
MTSDIAQIWMSGAWLNQTRARYTYDSYNSVTEETDDSWNAGNFWQAANNDKQKLYYYELYTPSGIATVADAGAALDLYPNPAGTLLNINLSWSEPQSATISIYDALGRPVRQWQSTTGTSYQANISVAPLAPGTYYLHAKGQSAELTKAFVISK